LEIRNWLLEFWSLSIANFYPKFSGSISKVNMPNNEPTEQELKMQRELFRAQRQDQIRQIYEDVESQPEQDLDYGLSEEEMRQRMESLRISERIRKGIKRVKAAKEMASKVEKSQKAISRLKNIYRLVNGFSAATLVGVIVTFLVMNAQLIFGNLFKVKFVPKLSIVEILILGLLWVIVAAAVFLALILIYFIAHPCEVVPLIGTWWAKMLGKACKLAT